jgi:hypothetical protein
MTAHQGRVIAAAIPLALVNTVAFAGQLAFLRARLPWTLAGQVTVAAALESIAVFLALHAHVAALANDSALRLRLAAYGFAAVIGAANYSHYAGPGWRPTFPALVTGLMSASSPWLWGIHSRRVSRDALMAAGLIEPHALRLGMTRWLWHPLRSGRVMFLATWEGITDPREAVTRWESTQARRAPIPLASEHLNGSAGAPETIPASAPALNGQVHPEPPARRTRSAPRKSAPGAPDPLAEFAAEVQSGLPPSLRQIRSRAHVGQDRAHEILADLEQAISERKAAGTQPGTAARVILDEAIAARRAAAREDAVMATNGSGPGHDS